VGEALVVRAGIQRRRVVAFMMLVTLCWGLSIAVHTASAGATTVAGEAAFRAAWADPTETAIVLDADVALTCGNGGVAVRNASTAVTVTGNSHTLRQDCAANGVLRQDGAGMVTLQSIIVTGGGAPGDGGGLAAVGDIAITDATIRGNTAGGKGGGVWTAGSATVTGSSFSDNQAGLTTSDGYGGGVFAQDQLSLTDSVLTANRADGSGGASGNQGSTILRSTISNNVGPDGGGGTGSFGAIVVRDSTISGNSALQSGAGGVGAVGPITLINSTVVENQAGAIGGGGAFSDSGVTLVYSTVVANAATGGAANLVGFPVTAFGSVVALPADGRPNCQTQTNSNGYNFSDDSSCGFNTATDHGSAGDPQLGPLTTNGGPTMTRAPEPGSPLVDVIPTEACQADGAAGLTTDQRGTPRPQGPACDIGSVDLAGAGPPPPTAVHRAPQFTG
jgi:Putative pectate lyase-like adhesive domain